jgi:hypothetical protein
MTDQRICAIFEVSANTVEGIFLESTVCRTQAGSIFAIDEVTTESAQRLALGSKYFEL